MAKLQARQEAVIEAPINEVWALITDIKQLHKTNPGVVKATGVMDQLNGCRTCEITNNGRTGTMTERLIELVPEKKTVWTIENDSMGISRILKDTRFCFHLEKTGVNKTKLINESYYAPVGFTGLILNALMMKRMMTKLQKQILKNIKNLPEKP